MPHSWVTISHILQSTGHLSQLLATVRTASSNFKLLDLPVSALKAALWAVGHVGSSELGIELIQEEFAFKHIVKIAESFDVLSVRGFAIFCSFVWCSFGSFSTWRFRSETCAPFEQSVLAITTGDWY